MKTETCSDLRAALERLMRLHGVERSWLEEKVDFTDDQAILRALNRGSRITALLRDLCREMEAS